MCTKVVVVVVVVVVVAVLCSISFLMFSNASSHLFKRPSLLVRWSVCWSVRNIFVKFDEIMMFQNEITATRRKERRGGRREKEGDKSCVRPHR